MSPQPGETLLHYRLIDKIGEGGMGVVWKAIDTTLDREVAIKLLPDRFVQDAERLARFEREAKLLASLEHPNIAAVYGLHDVPSTGSGRFIAMELVAGEDLQERLNRGALPVDDTVDIACQIAAALEAAHDAGVVHRDLKPANVRIAPDGRLRVLDFGLAKAVESARGSGASLAMSPTVTSAGTQAGVILGTAAYMSPEQARGKPVDRRTDVWSFGCVLYELLTGRAAYSGETVTDVLAAILQREPDWKALPARTPPGVRAVIERCLAKDPRERLRDMGDVGLLLRDGAGATADTATATPTKNRGLLWPAIAAVLMLVLAGLALTGRIGGATHTGAAPATVVGITQLTDLPGLQVSPSLSADAEQLLYVARDGKDQDIFLQRVGGENPINLTADFTDDDYQPAFSPDRRQIAFGSRREGGGIFIMGATGESPRRVSDKGFDPAWSPDGTKLIYTTERVTDPYSRGGPAVLWVVDVASGERTQLHDIDAAGADWSPSGKRIAFWTHYATVKGQRDIWTIDAEGGEPLAVTDDAHTDWDPFWSPDGRWLYFISDRGGSPDLWRTAIDEATGRTEGEPQPVTAGIVHVAEASISADGRRIAITALRGPGTIQTARFDPVNERLIGEPATVIASSGAFSQMELSYDGEWIAYRTLVPKEMLYVARADGTSRRKLLDDQHRNRGPSWSPDGRWLTFYSNRSGSYQIWAIRPNGTDLVRLTGGESFDVESPQWLPDGSGVAVSTLDTEAGNVWYTGILDLTTADLDSWDGEIVPRDVEGTKVLHMSPGTVSPDGKRIGGYALDQAGETVVAVYDFATDTVELPRRPDGRPYRSWQDPTWLDGDRLVFWDLELDHPVVLDVERGEARTLSGVPGPSTFDFTPDGRTIVIHHQARESDVWLLTLAE